MTEMSILIVHSRVTGLQIYNTTNGLLLIVNILLYVVSH